MMLLKVWHQAMQRPPVMPFHCHHGTQTSLFPPHTGHRGLGIQPRSHSMFFLKKKHTQKYVYWVSHEKQFLDNVTSDVLYRQFLSLTVFAASAVAGRRGDSERKAPAQWFVVPIVVIQLRAPQKKKKHKKKNLLCLFLWLHKTTVGFLENATTSIQRVILNVFIFALIGWWADQCG